MRLVILLLVLLVSLQARAADHFEPGCREIRQDENRYLACGFDPARASIALHARDAAGKAYGYFEPLFADLLRQGRLPVFAMNGGMYEDDLSPVGLFVEKGQEIRAANTRDGWGNFHLKPNGVFFLKNGVAGVEETDVFLRRQERMDYATQSGPMLVIRGKLHPKFLPDSDSLKIRNGVGVDRKGRVWFVISEDRVRFHDMALLYRDVLDCPDALYLDGTISSVYAPGTGRFDRFFPMGPIVTVTVGWPRVTTR